MVNLNKYNSNLKVHSFVIKTIVQHMIEGVNKSRKMNLGLATLVLPGPITTLMNFFFVSILLLRKSIHTRPIILNKMVYIMIHCSYLQVILPIVWIHLPVLQVAALVKQQNQIWPRQRYLMGNNNKIWWREKSLSYLL